METSAPMPLVSLAASFFGPINEEVLTQFHLRAMHDQLKQVGPGSRSGRAVLAVAQGIERGCCRCS